MSKPLPGQFEACEAFRAGLVLAKLNLPQFSNITGYRFDVCKNWWQGDSKPTDAALLILKLIYDFEVTRAELTDLRGLDLREEARRVLSAEDYEREVPLLDP